MTIDTGAFVAGVGVLVALDSMSLALTFEAYRQVGQDREARKRARQAKQRARETEEQIQEHVRNHHRSDGGAD